MPSTLITGANRGLGLEFARQYLADGWSMQLVANQHLLPDCTDLPSKLKFSPHTVAEIIAKCPQVSSSEFATSARGERSLSYTGALQGRILRSPIRRSG